MSFLDVFQMVISHALMAVVVYSSWTHAQIQEKFALSTGIQSRVRIYVYSRPMSTSSDMESIITQGSNQPPEKLQ